MSAAASAAKADNIARGEAEIISDGDARSAADPPIACRDLPGPG
jgi:hypothetical protein